MFLLFFGVRGQLGFYSGTLDAWGRESGLTERQHAQLAEAEAAVAAVLALPQPAASTATASVTVTAAAALGPAIIIDEARAGTATTGDAGAVVAAEAGASAGGEDDITERITHARALFKRVRA